MAELALRTQADVFRLPLPRTGEAVYFDQGSPKDRAPGLALRVRAAGSRKFVFFYRHGGRQLKLTIGDASGWDLAKARKAARAYRVQVEKGDSPTVEKATKRAASALLFSSVAADYLAVKQRVMKPRSLVENTRHLNRDWKPLHGLSLAAVSRYVIAARLRVIVESSGPVAADRARSTLSSLFAWAIGEGLCDSNPVTGTNKASEGSQRERVLTDAELAAIWNATAADTDYGRIVRLLMLTAQRRDEIGGLHWSEIDTDAKAILLPPARVKNGCAHSVPLSDLSMDVLMTVHKRTGRDLVFGNGESGYSGWSRSKERLDATCGVEGWTLHDLRRTAATRMADSGVQPHIIEAVLNHVSGHKSGVAGIYNKAAYEPEKRAALDTLASYIKTAVARAQGANVVRIKGKARRG